MSTRMSRLAAVALLATLTFGAPQFAKADVVYDLDLFDTAGTGVTGVTRDSVTLNNAALSGSYLNYLALGEPSDPTDSFTWGIAANGPRTWGTNFELAIFVDRTNEVAELLTVRGNDPADPTPVTFAWTLTDVNSETVDYSASLDNLDSLSFSSSDFSANGSFDFDAVSQVQLVIDSNVGTDSGEGNLLVTFNGGRLAVTAVPEPSTVGVLALAGLGLVGFRTVRRRRQK